MKRVMIPFALIMVLSISACGVQGSDSSDMDKLIEQNEVLNKRVEELEKTVAELSDKNVSDKVESSSSGINGMCGNNLTWEFSDGVLTIDGTGEMYEYDYYTDEEPPWVDIRGEIKKVIVEKGCTYIGCRALGSMSNATDLMIKSCETQFDAWALLSAGQPAGPADASKEELDKYYFDYVSKAFFEEWSSIKNITWGNRLYTLNRFIPDVWTKNGPQNSFGE